MYRNALLIILAIVSLWATTAFARSVPNRSPEPATSPQSVAPGSGYANLNLEQLIDLLPKTEKGYSDFKGDLAQLLTQIASVCPEWTIGSRLTLADGSIYRGVALSHWNIVVASPVIQTYSGPKGSVQAINASLVAAGTQASADRYVITAPAAQVRTVAVRPIQLGSQANTAEWVDKPVYQVELTLPAGTKGVRGHYPGVANDSMSDTCEIVLACTAEQAERIAVGFKKLVEMLGARDVQFIPLPANTALPPFFDAGKFRAAAAYTGRAELMPDSIKGNYRAWAAYFDAMATGQPGGDAPKVVPGSASSRPLAEGVLVEHETFIESFSEGVQNLQAYQALRAQAQSNPTGALSSIVGSILDQDNRRSAANRTAKLGRDIWHRNVEDLTKQVADWCTTNADPGANAFLKAAAAGNLDSVKQWVEAGNDPNACGPDGVTALHCTPSLPIARYLLQHGADVSAKDTSLNDPLKSVLAVGDRWKARLLLDAGAPPNSLCDSGPFFDGTNVMQYAKYPCEPALRGVCRNGDIQAALMLLAVGGNPGLGDPDKGGDKLEIYGDDLHRLISHFRSKDNTVAKSLSQIGKPDPGGVAMSYAVACPKNSSAAQVDRLLNKGVSLDARDEYSWTPLMNAAQAGNLEIIKLLLEKPASVDAKNAFGQTALMLAIRCNRAGYGAKSVSQVKELVETLVAGGASGRPRDISNKGARDYLLWYATHEKWDKQAVRELAEILNKAEKTKDRH